ncbi:hypothetical protein [Calidithermus roseus]|uniref:Uncharacterized protein n=1 Tax=Calidithermus roseus TaxID=1644118 RepID=A0A399EGQ4_9DEIN|nr:hypothetical protein [Calidithermus roseus]RIH82916.1 hypothetical protein Mrose_03234 [Calidithermus roseus]
MDDPLRDAAGGGGRPARRRGGPRPLVLALVLALALVSPAMAQDFSADDYLYSFPDQRFELNPQGHWPYLVLTRKSLLEACAGGQSPCGRYEWWLPYSTLQATQAVARDLRRAWARFEERYFWRVQTALNQPALSLAYCSLGLSLGDLDASPPPVQLETAQSFLPSALPAPLPTTPPASAGLHRLDLYLPLPQVPAADFCDGLSVEFVPIMAIPPFCLELDFIGFSWCTPGYPDEPLWFNEDHAAEVVRRAIDHGLKRYGAEYQQQVLQALAPRVNPGALEVFAPLAWQAHLSGTGAVVAAVGDLAPDPARLSGGLQAILQAVRQARLPQPEDGLRLPYYGQSLLALSRVGPLAGVAGPLCQAVAGCAEGLFEQALRAAVATSGLSGVQKPYAPGLWRLEQLKRFFPPSHPLIQEAFGYASFFQAWNQLTFGTVPDLTARWVPGEYALAQAQRVVGYWYVPVKLKIVLQQPWLIPQPDLPRLRPVAPYFLPYALERTHWSWVSVPEGYRIPRVAGTPGLGVPGGPAWDADALYRVLLR